MLDRGVSELSSECFRPNLRAKNRLTCIGKLAQETNHIESSLRVQSYLFFSFKPRRGK